MFPRDPDDVVRDPVSLEAIADLPGLERDGCYHLRAGGLSRKNRSEMAHFLSSYQPLSAAEKCYATKIRILPAPQTTDQTRILDIGCGPYDCISAIAGQHFFLDDIMDLYCEELGVRSDGMRISARTELMPFRDGAFDVIYAINMIDHVDDMPATLLEIHRVLAPGGTVYVQSYFNSHPLLATEPGVFDAHFERAYIRPLFEVRHYQTYAVGDPNISASYNMPIVAAVLGKKHVRAEDMPAAKPRARYSDPGYHGPQSAIIEALGAIDAGELERARALIDRLSAEAFYEIQMRMLDAKLDIARGELRSAGDKLAEVAQHDRVRNSGLARVAVFELQAQRARAARVRSRMRRGRARVRGALRRILS